MKNKVHIIWIGSKYPYQKNKKSFEKYGYEVVLWTEGKNLINQDIFDQMTTYAGKADVMRLELLYKYGGLYTDADSKMIKPLKIDTDLICMRSHSGYIANETIYAEKEHPALKEAIYGLKEHIETLPEEVNIWEIAGATYITPIFRKYTHKVYTREEIGIKHDYLASWAKGVRKSEKKPLNYWLCR